MTDRDDLLLSKAPLEPAPLHTTAPSLPPALLRRAVRRVRFTAFIMLGMMVFGWLVSNLLEGQLAAEFQRVGEWAPATFVLVASLAMIGITRLPRVPAEMVVTTALTYEVAISWGIAFSTYWDTFASMTPLQMEPDVVGLQWVAVWMMFFTLMVPAQPQRALAALLLSAISIPTVYLLEVKAGRAPVLEPGAVWELFVAPYFLVAGMSYVAARIIYRLGQDVKRAQDMGSYRLVERLGFGGMGEVWRARHRMLARPAAVKLIHRDALGSDPQRASELISRFEREAQVTASLQSPHTVELYDFGTTDDGTFYYVMELLEGIDLERLVQRFGPLPQERTVNIVRQICVSLGEAHRHGLVHRDVKPANVYLCQRAFEYDFVKVLDFGLVKWHSAKPSDEDLRLSQTGVIHGTPSYMAPEVAHGELPIDGRADVYAVGCLAYWLLAGRLVFEEQSYPAMLLAHTTKQPDPPSRHTERPVSPQLDDIVMRCLRKDPADRVQSAEGLIAELDALVPPEPWTQERAAKWWEVHGV